MKYVIKNNVIYLLTVDTEGKPCYFFVKTDHKKTIIFQNDVANNSTLNIEKYGELLEYGYGKKPPYRVKDNFIRTHQFLHEDFN